MARWAVLDRLMKAIQPRAVAADVAAGDDPAGSATTLSLAPDGPPLAVRKVQEAFGITAGMDADEGNWRRLTGDAARDLSPMDRARMREMAVYLWQTNLLANRMIELPIAYLLAEGAQLVCKDPEANKQLRAFWTDPINRVDIKLPKRVREMYLFGEQCWPVFVNEMSGAVRWSNLDPALIATVVTDPDNPEQPIGVVTVKDKKGVARRYRVIVPGPETVFTERTREIRAGFPDGLCFYYVINDLTMAVRGHSALLGHIDWADAYETYLFGEIDRAAILRSFMWDVTLKGATAEEVKARSKEIHAPRSNSVRVHNDSEEWETVAPQLNAADTSEAARLFRNHMLGGRTIPEHWFGGGGDVNRATGDSMGEPTFKVLSMDQFIWRTILEDIGRFVVSRFYYPDGSQWVDVDDPDLAPSAIFPELTTRDIASAATALAQVVAAMASAVDRGFFTELTAVHVINTCASRLGVEIDAEAELKAAKEEAAARKEEDAFREVPDDPDNPEPGPADEA